LGKYVIVLPVVEAVAVPCNAAVEITIPAVLTVPEKVGVILVEVLKLTLALDAVAVGAA
jgi:hypothetical protein